MFSSYNRGSQKITLIEDGNIISNDEDIARIFNNYSVDYQITMPLNHAEKLPGPVEIALHKFKCHPIIIEIKEKVFGEFKFSFSKIMAADTTRRVIKKRQFHISSSQKYSQCSY